MKKKKWAAQRKWDKANKAHILKQKRDKYATDADHRESKKGTALARYYNNLKKPT